MTRTNDGRMTVHDWQSGWVRKGHISDVGFVTMPRKATHARASTSCRKCTRPWKYVSWSSTMAK